MRENKLADLSMQLAVKGLNFTDEIEGHYPLKNKSKSALGDSGTCSISRHTAEVFIRPCSQNAS